MMVVPEVNRRTFLAAVGLSGLCAACNVGAPAEASDAPREGLYLCEGCDAAFERDAATLQWQTRMAPTTEPGEPMRVEGRVLQSDRQSPAANVTIYAWQTNVDGLYANGTSETEWSRLHGRLRGWVKTGSDGRYGFDTIKPSPYPGLTMPAHIHLAIVEPGKPVYYVDDIVFDGEFGVTAAYRASQELRGGSGIVMVRQQAGRWVAQRDIILERHPPS